MLRLLRMGRSPGLGRGRGIWMSSRRECRDGCEADDAELDELAYGTVACSLLILISDPWSYIPSDLLLPLALTSFFTLTTATSLTLA